VRPVPARPLNVSPLCLGGIHPVKRPHTIDRLRKQGWTVVTRPERALELPSDVAARHPKLPAALASFLGGLSSCVDDARTAWFLCEADYGETSGAAFRWDEWERISSEAAGDDRQLGEAVRGFWDEHLPFLLSVRDGYVYFAVRTAADGFGRVVTGREPEFEEASQVARTFDEFLLLLADGAVRA
jgi:hypothetical protein